MTNKKKLLYTNIICNNIENILDALNIEYTIYNGLVKLKCPIHDSDSITSSTISISKQMWSCWSHQCHNEYPREYSIVEFVKACLKTKKYKEVYNFVDTHALNKSTKIVEPVKPELKMVNRCLIPKTKTPSEYFVGRGFDPKTLKKFGVGDCFVGYYKDRAVVPIYHEHKIVGLSGRSHFDECPLCKGFHSPYKLCSEVKQPKWKFNKGFAKSQTLYNIDGIKYSKKVAIVEGMSCVWKLHENNIKAIAILGGDFSYDRLSLLLSHGVKDTLLLMDNDEAGKEFKRSFIKRYKDKINIHLCSFKSKDISDMDIEEFEQTVKRKWDKI